MSCFPRWLAVLVAVVLVALPAAGAAEAPADKGPSAAGDAGWYDFTPAALRRALAESRLVLLVIEMPWSDLCARARAEVWRDPRVDQIIRSGFVPIRVRGDLRPELVRRYPAESWPAVSVLLPDGAPMYFQPKDDSEPRRLTTGFRTAEKMAGLLQDALSLFRKDPNAAARQSQQQEAAIDKALLPEGGPTAETAVWTMAGDLRATFDPERRYFGGPPRLPRFDLIELMLVLGGETEDPWRTIGLAALDTMSSKLVDPADGALQRMALGLDWEDVQKEKLLDRNARHLDALTLAWRETGARTYRDRLLKAADFLTTKLSRPDGAFAAGLAAGTVKGVDDTVLSGWNGLAATALIRAGAAASEPKLVERGLSAAKFLKERRHRPGRLTPRAVVGGEAILPDNLEDQAEVAWAFYTAYEATGDPAWLDATKDLLVAVLSNLKDPSVGALRDIIGEQPGAPRPLRRALYPLAANADVVRLLIRLYYLTEDHRFRDAARSLLTAFGKSPGGPGVGQADYLLAMYEYYMPPITVAVIGDPADARTAGLRLAALGAAFPWVIVRTLDPARDADVARKLALPITETPTAYAFHAGLISQPVREHDGLRGVLAALREKHLAKEKTRPTKAPQGSRPRDERPGHPSLAPAGPPSEESPPAGKPPGAGPKKGPGVSAAPESSR